jgi:ABC-type sugar transport system ATPase subunit
MRDGRIEQVASPHEIFTRPTNLFVAGFIGTPQMNLLAGRFTGRENGLAHFRTAEQELRLPLNGLADRGIRPRAFDLASEPELDTLSAEADLIEPMGAETLVHAADGARDIRVVVPRRLKVGQGDVLHLRPKLGQVHLVGEDGRRIGA